MNIKKKLYKYKSHTFLFLFPLLSLFPLPRFFSTTRAKIRDSAGKTYCILLILIIGLDLYRHGLIGSVITGATEPRPRPDESPGLFLLVLDCLLVLRGRAVNVDEVAATRRRLQHGFLGGQG